MRLLARYLRTFRELDELVIRGSELTIEQGKPDDYDTHDAH